MPSIVTLTGVFFRNTFLADSGVSIDIYGETEEMVSIKPVDVIIFSGFLQSKKELENVSMTVNERTAKEANVF